jgi:hypothetical protein
MEEGKPMVTSPDILEERKSAVPRGPPEWGQLIYQEPWAYKRRHPGKYDLLLIALILIFGGVLIAAGLAFTLTKSWVLVAIYAGIGVYLYLGAANYVMKLRHTLPLRVYGKGVTMPKPEPSRRYDETEHYFPYSRILHVTVKEDSWPEGPSTFLKFLVQNEHGLEKERIVSPKRGVEAGPIVEALKRADRDLVVETVAEASA